MKPGALGKILFPGLYVAVMVIGVYLFISAAIRLLSPSETVTGDAENAQAADLKARYVDFFTREETADDWRGLGVALSMHDLKGASSAFLNAARLSDDNAERLLLLGASAEQLVRLEGGRVSRDAKEIFEQILALDASDLGALYYLGLEARQRSDLAAIQHYWSQFAAAAPAEHPLQQAVRDQLISDGGFNGGAAQERVTEILALSKAEQEDRIREMVAGLRGRLEAAGGTGEEWRQLARSYVRLGKYEDALWAYDHAVAAAPDNDAIWLERSQLGEGRG